MKTNQLKGELISLSERLEGSRSNGDKWSSQGFVIQTEGQYKKNIYIVDWNDKCELSKFTIGDILDVYVNFESREYNGRWYTDVKSWKIEGQTNPDILALAKQIEESDGMQPNLDFDNQP